MTSVTKFTIFIHIFVTQTADFSYESSPTTVFTNLIDSQRQTNATMPLPLMNSEYYTGGLSFWGDKKFPLP